MTNPLRNKNIKAEEWGKEWPAEETQEHVPGSQRLPTIVQHQRPFG